MAQGDAPGLRGLGLSAGRAHVMRPDSSHRIPPRVRDDRERPSVGRDG